MKDLKNKNGITLIALVITIIVMLILAAVSITMAVNGGLFGYAQNASTETQRERDLELELGNLADNLTYDDLIDKYAVLTVTKYGDLDLDGDVDGDDVDLLERYLLRDTNPNHINLGKQALLNADANADGKVNGRDEIILEKTQLEPQNEDYVDPDTLPYTGE